MACADVARVGDVRAAPAAAATPTVSHAGALIRIIAARVSRAAGLSHDVDDQAESSRDATSPSSPSFRWAGESMHRGTRRSASFPSGSIVRLGGPISIASLPAPQAKRMPSQMARLSRGPLERREDYQESPRQTSNMIAGHTFAKGPACSRGDQLLSCRSRSGVSRVLSDPRKSVHRRGTQPRIQPWPSCRAVAAQPRPPQSCATIGCREGSVGSSPRPRARACAERRSSIRRAPA